MSELAEREGFYSDTESKATYVDFTGLASQQCEILHHRWCFDYAHSCSFL